MRGRERRDAADASGGRPPVPSLASPLALVAAVLAAYAVSLTGGWLNYDDAWLIRDNPILARADLGALGAIWGDLSRGTRDALGAEYLPVRDTVVWLQLRLLGPSPRALRGVGLLLYLGGVLLMRAYLVKALPDRRAAELAAWLFALHPVHAESAAWLAGQKDLLALVCMAGALLLYAAPPGASRGVALTVPLLVLAGTLGKAVAVVTPALLLLDDHLRGRRPRWAVVAAASVVALAAFWVQLRVGQAVGMMAPWPGGGRLATAATMGPVWMQYLWSSFVPVGLSVHHDVTVRGAGEPLAWGGYLVLGLLALGAVMAHRRGLRVWGWALGIFVVPLVPTSQLLAPLQNLRADRYLLVAALGPCVVLGLAAARLRWRALAAALPLAFAALTIGRAWVFADSVRLWQDAAGKTRTPTAPYQLGKAYQERGRVAEAEAAFAQAVARARPGDDVGRAAANNLAASHASRGRLDLALPLLQQVVDRFPDDPRALNNLAEVTARGGNDAEARRLFEKLVRRFPSYQPGLANFRKRYGALPPR